MNSSNKLNDKDLEKTSGGNYITNDMKCLNSFDINKVFCDNYNGSKTGNERSCNNCKNILKNGLNCFCTHNYTPNNSNQKTNPSAMRP